MQAASDITPEALAAKGREANRQGDWSAALNHWAVFHALYQSLPEGFLQFGETLWRLGHFAPADEILKRGMEKFPAEEGLYASYAWSGMAQGKWTVAEARFRATLDRFPEAFGQRFGLALALRELGRLAEAETVLLAGVNLDSDWPSRQLLAELAAAMGNSDLAGERWRDLLARQPDNPEFHVGYAAFLRSANRLEEAERALQAAVDRFPQNMTMLRLLAEIAERASDWPLALRRWDAFKTVYGSRPEGFIGAGRALMRLDRLDDAEVVTKPAARLFSQDVDILTLFAEIATRAGRWTEASARWQAVQKLAPERPDGFLGEITALRASGDADKAQELFAKVRQLFPADLQVLCQHAVEAQQSRLWPEAVGRWRTVVLRFPKELWPRLELVRCLTMAGAFDRAEAAAEEALALLPGNLDLLQLQAEIPTGKGDARLAEMRWTALLDRAPEFWPARLGYARFLRQRGEPKKAFEFVEAAAPRFGSVLSFNVERARLLAELKEWSTALPILAEIHKQSGGNRSVRAEIDYLVGQAELDLKLAAAGSEGAPAPFVIPPTLLRSDADQAWTRDRIKALMMRFDSLGDSCEFGMVQSRFGAEPISLLRSTGTPPERLAAAFRARLAGIGEPEFTELTVDKGEYITIDSRYHMSSHTFTKETAVPRDKFYASQCTRLRFLRDKLIRDIRTAEKIFVYGSAALNDALIDELFDAIRSLGPRATLLCVRVADADHLAGTVKFRRDGLLVGGIRGFSTVDTAVDEWLRICEAAAEMIPQEPPASV